MVHATLAVLAALFSAGALWLLCTGWLAAPRLNNDPHCRECGYNLLGLDLTSPDVRCPECGRLLASAAIVRGGRRIRRGRVVGGVALAGLALGLGVLNPFSAAALPALLRLTPTTMLIYLAHHAPSDSVGIEAWYALGDRDVRGQLGQSDYRTLLEHALEIDMQVRPEIAAGAELPQRLVLRTIPTMPKPKRSSLFACASVAVGEVRVNGQARPMQPVATLPEWRLLALRQLDIGAHEPGEYRIEQDIEAKYGGIVIRRTLVSKTTVRPASKIAPIRVRQSPDLDAAIAASVCMSHVFRTAQPWNPVAPARDLRQVSFGIEAIATLPVALAFDVFVETDAGERRIGTCAAIGSVREGFGYVEPFEWPHRAPDTITVVLRSSLARAARTPDITEIWNGELRFERVPIQANSPGCGNYIPKRPTVARRPN